MTAARRLAAILAADVVGYSRLMGEVEAARKNLRVARRIDNVPVCRKHSQ
jgi:class 3 adenylate cyclase